ncbi:hypothetical protein [Paenibacillus humicus]|uniref:hypothetical protein n=1 Tax=Paenibacillus humicus TaxID=412861 RepID=UPI003F13AE0F
MLNKNQKRFKKRMQQAQDELEQTPATEVYSYIMDDKVSHYYTGKNERFQGSSFAFKLIRVMLWGVLILLAVLLVVGVVTADAKQKSTQLFVPLVLMSLICLFFGLFSPRLVLPKKTASRKKIVGWYGILLIVSFIGFVTTLQPQDGTSLAAKAPATSTVVDVEQLKKEAIGFDYLALARNPEKLKGTKVYLKGKIVQALESRNQVELRVDITKGEYGIWTDTVYVDYELPKGGDRLLEGDIINFWGTVEGLKSYQAIFGQKVSLPEIHAFAIEFVRHE